MTTSEICQDVRRRQQIRDRHWNGLDYVEVAEDQLTLTVFFLRKAPAHILKENVRIEGGRRVTGINVLGIDLCRVEDDERDDCMRVVVDKRGDFTTYKLCLIQVDNEGRPIFDTDEQGRKHFRPMEGMDPRYACVEFSFKAGCATDLDCAIEPVCPPQVFPAPESDYLAKDYASFRQLILDRLALIMPDWQERHVPDLGITLVELLAYAGDHLSYFQDAVATEAYLDTARKRVSVRRHVRLVDYVLHEGCNARAWVCLDTSADETFKRDEMSFITGRNDGVPFRDTLLTPDDVRGLPHGEYEVFEPISAEEIRVYTAHNSIDFYTWGDKECCLPRGATAATLRDEWIPVPTSAEGQKAPEPSAKQDKEQASGVKGAAAGPAAERKLDHLRKGDVLILEQVRDPNTGNPADANPLHRHAVRLTQVTREIDQLYDQPVVEIEWALEDALPFPLCLSAVTDAPECAYLEGISVARGNVVLVDHGRTPGRIKLDEAPYEDLGQVPVAKELPPCKDTPCPAEVEAVAGRYRPQLKQAPLTFSQPIERHASAAGTIMQDPRRALASIKLEGNPPGREGYTPWSPRLDLLGSQAQDTHYVVEIDNDGRAYLRFGDGELGRAPQGGARFRAKYRVGIGPVGNVGADTILHIVFRDTRYSDLILRPRNPLPASGGTTPEPIDGVKFFASHAFRKELARAITAEDYAEIASRDDRVQRAAAALRWTGSWYEARVAIDPKGKVEPDAALLNKVASDLRPFRRIGHDLAVKAVQNVPLDVELTVCVQSDHLVGHVKAAVLDVLSNRRLPDGKLSFFHPDNLTCGEDVYLSKLIAAVRAVEGVENVVAKTFKRYGELPNQEIKNGLIPISPLEVARLDNDSDLPENGVLKLDMVGGR